jgi:hypothetical protein
MKASAKPASKKAPASTSLVEMFQENVKGVNTKPLSLA